jgi:hypothetical protein
MGISRRKLLVAGAVAAGSSQSLRGSAATAAKATPQKISGVVLTDTVERLSWMFNQPSSGNTQMGFSLRKGKMRRNLNAYMRIFAQRFGHDPDPGHLFVAGTVIYSCEPWVACPPRIAQLAEPEPFITDESFEKARSIVSARLKSVSAAG